VLIVGKPVRSLGAARWPSAELPLNNLTRQHQLDLEAPLAAIDRDRQTLTVPARLPRSTRR
jgi:hypothetical protein